MYKKVSHHPDNLLDVFYDISTLVGYLMSNLVYIYIYIYIFILFVNE